MVETNATNLMNTKRRPMYQGRQVLEERKDEEINNTSNPDGSPEGTPNADVTGHDTANLPPEEKTYAKRYADLRRESQRRDSELTTKMKELQDKLDVMTSRGGKLPVSEAEITEWMQKYPDLANAIMHLADRTASDKMKRLKEQMDRLEEDSLEVKREKAYLELKRLHPDVDAIRESQDFHTWVETQPGEIQGWFYENETDYVLAARGISLFKLETGWKAGRKKEPTNAINRENSRSVVPAVAPEINPEGGQKRQWRESEIRKLKGKEFEKYEAEIELAMQEGRIVRDLTTSRM